MGKYPVEGQVIKIKKNVSWGKRVGSSVKGQVGRDLLNDVAHKIVRRFSANCNNRFQIFFKEGYQVRRFLIFLRHIRKISWLLVVIFYGLQLISRFLQVIQGNFVPDDLEFGRTDFKRFLNDPTDIKGKKNNP